MPAYGLRPRVLIAAASPVSGKIFLSIVARLGSRLFSSHLPSSSRCYPPISISLAVEFVRQVLSLSFCVGCSCSRKTNGNESAVRLSRVLACNVSVCVQ